MIKKPSILAWLIYKLVDTLIPSVTKLVDRNVNYNFFNKRVMSNYTRVNPFKIHITHYKKNNNFYPFRQACHICLGI